MIASSRDNSLQHSLWQWSRTSWRVTSTSSVMQFEQIPLTSHCFNVFQDLSSYFSSFTGQFTDLFFSVVWGKMPSEVEGKDLGSPARSQRRECDN